MTNSLSLALEIETSKVNLIFPHLRDNFNMLLLSITHHIQTSPISDFFFFFWWGWWLLWDFVTMSRLSLVMVSRGYSLAAMLGLLTVEPSLVAERGL